MSRRRSRRSSRGPGARIIGALFACSLVTAACISSVDDDTTTDDTTDVGTKPLESAPGTDPTTTDPTTTDASVPGTDPSGPGETDGDPTIVRTATRPPAAGGLPSLTDGDPDTISGTLDNGLDYLIRENGNPGSKVDLRLVIDAGSGLEDDDQLGGAHFLEHMLFNGTEKYPENELIDVLRSFGASFGADINAYTSFDETVYTLIVPTGDPGVVATGLDVLGQWLSSATITEDDVIAERGIVLDEWRVRDQTASGRLFDEVARLFLDGTPYEGHTPIGGGPAIQATQAGPLRRFYDDWYRPDNAAIVVVGDIVASDVEEQIVDLFSDEVARGDSPVRDALVVEPSSSPVARVASDPDLAEGYAFVTLPTAPSDGSSIEADAQVEFFRRLAFEIIATRLNNDALRGEAPYDSAEVADSEFVRDLVAPEIYVTVDGENAADAVDAVLDEYERVARYGFTQTEIDRATGAVLSAAETAYDGRASRQDSSYADEYVDHVLTGDPYVTAQREFDFITEVMNRATPENVAHVFIEHLDAAAPHVFVAVPSSEADAAPTEADLIRSVVEAATRPLEPRGTDDAIGDELIERPEPIEAVSTDSLADRPFPEFIDPVVVTFPNGVRVAFNSNRIVEGQVFVEGRSPGGLAVLPDADVPDGDALRRVVSDSGVGAFDRVAIDEFLDDKEVVVAPYVELFEDRIEGQGATSDLEVLFQMIHLTMSQPRVDPVALDQYLDDELPYARNPGLDSGYAEFVALQDARYDDIRFLAPTPETLASVDADGIARVAADRFGDAGDWAFSFSGEFSVAEATELARRYLATLPATDRSEDPGFVEPPPPPGAVVVETQAGQGETANVSFLFTASATTNRRDDVLGRVVQEIVGNRLTDFIREELGDSYSPFAAFSIGPGGDPQTEFYISVSTAPDLVTDVSEAVLGQLADLREDGPTEREFDNAVATVGEELNFFNNGQINDEVLDALVDPEGSPDFDDFLDEFEELPTITADDVSAALVEWAPADQYIEVRVLPRT